MPHIRSRWSVAGKRFAIALLAALAAAAATRPHYGGTLRVETRLTPASPEALGVPPGFVVSVWEAGRRAVFTADDNAPNGRPFLDAIEIQLGRSLRDQSADLELGKTDIVELGPNELRRQAANRRVWGTSAIRVMALVFGPRIDDARVRESLALAVDRAAIQNVLLQKQGEISGALLPQWVTGYAFLFRAPSDVARARGLAQAAPQSQRTFSLAADDLANRAIADRIALNARDAGLTVSMAPSAAAADVRLVEARIAYPDPPHALAAVAAALGLAEPPAMRTPEDQYTAERNLLEGFRVVPLFHLPNLYGYSPRVRGGPVTTPLGEFRFDSLWLEERP